MKHACHAIGCEREIAPKLLMCLPHWSALSKPAQRIIWHHYRPGQEIHKDPSALYLLAQGAAVALVAFRDRTWSARQALDRLAEVCLRAAKAGIAVDRIEETLRAMGCEQIREPGR
jgi:hypothetical protein